MQIHLIKLLSATAAACFFANAYPQLPLPTAKQYGSTTFISGGIGIDECKALQTEACNWSLQLMFSEIQSGSTIGAWVSDVDIKITDKDGYTVLATMTEGPLVLVNLSPGAYTLTANYLGKLAVRPFTIIEGRNQTISVSWVTK